MKVRIPQVVWSGRTVPPAGCGSCRHVTHEWATHHQCRTYWETRSEGTCDEGAYPVGGTVKPDRTTCGISMFLAHDA